MRILLVEDDEAIALGLVYSLEKDGYTLVHAKNTASAMFILAHDHFDLLILDISLPDGNGYDICAAAKKMYDVPVIFLTALDDEVNVVMGLDMGGDDYITKPFRIKELLSRIRSIMRRYGKQENNSIAHIRHLDIDTRSAKVYKHGEEVFLSALEYRLLLIFINHPGQILTRSVILEGLWDAAGSFVNDNTLSVYIRRLREKLEEHPQEPCIIVTVRGMGYRLENDHEKE